jgi:hypothetical protein
MAVTKVAAEDRCELVRAQRWRLPCIVLRTSALLVRRGTTRKARRRKVFCRTLTMTGKRSFLYRRV